MEKQDRQFMIDKAYKELAKEIRRDLIDEIVNDIQQRINQMEKLLENGAPIWAHALGKSFERIHDTRQRIYRKIYYLREMQYSILERY